MACTDVQTIQAGNGTKTQFSFDFPYIFKSEIHVYFWNVTTKEYDEILTTDATYPWQITDANPTIVEFTGTAPPSPATPTDPGEPTVDNVKIRRITKVDDIRALFNPGSAIRSDDLNKNFEQLRYAIQEANCQGIPDDVDAYLKNYYWDRYDNTLYDGDTWVSDDTKIATTAALDARFQDEVNDTFTKAELAAASNIMPDDDVAVPTTGALDNYINEVLTNDIAGSDGVSITDDGDGTITVGLTDSSVDFDKIKDADQIQLADQVADPDVEGTDNNIFTARAATRRFNNYYQNDAPATTDGIGIGQIWVDPNDDLTMSVWSGSNWVGVTSGGTFTNQPKVIYVDANSGDDTNDGHRISRPKKTIAAALSDINADSVYGDGSIVSVAPGIYAETLPLDIQKNDVGIIGQSLRTCIIHPKIPAADQSTYDVDVPHSQELQTMFRVNSGSYFTNLTLTGLKASGTRGGVGSLYTDSTYGLPVNQGWNFAFYPNAVIKKSPYIQNVTNFSDSQINNVTFTPHTPGEGAAGDLDSAPTGGGILVDGSVPDSSSPLRSMVCDSYTHTALDGPGIFVTNNGYCQATSSYAFFNHAHITCINGGQANLAASTTDFGRFGLIADGKSSTAIFTSNVDGAASSGDTTFNINAPTADSGWFGSATRPANNMLVTVNSVTYPVLSATSYTDSEGGAGWTVTISRPDPTDTSTNLGLNGAVSDDAAVSFFLRSMVASSGHTMEYVGSGTNYTALPENGGVPVENQQIIERNDGKVWAATTDHKGTFKLGDFFTVDQQAGSLTVNSGSFQVDLGTLNVNVGGQAEVGADLDMGANELTSSTGDLKLQASGDINVQTNKIINVTDPTAAQDAATKAYVDNNTIGEVVDDASPQLGGNLDVNGYEILSTGNGDITINPAGTGQVVLDANVKLPAGSASAPSFYSGTDTNTGLYFSAADEISVATGGTQRVVVDSSGRLLVGTTSAVTAPDDKVQINSSTGIGIHRGEAGVAGPRIDLTKSRNATHGSNTIVQSGDLLGSIFFRGDDGTDYNSAGAQILCQVDGTPGANDMPGRLVFSTTADGASSPSERLRIDSSGRVGVGTSSPSSLLTLGGNDTTGSSQKITYKAGSTDAASIEFVTEEGGINRDAGIKLNVMQNDSPFTLLYAEGTNGGRVGIGTTSPEALTHIQGTSSGGRLDCLRMTNNTTTAGSETAIIFENTTGTFEHASIVATREGSGTLNFEVAENERMRIDSSGRLLVGTSTATKNADRLSGNTLALVDVGAGNYPSHVITGYGDGNADAGPLLDMQKSRGSTDGSMTIVADDDRLGTINFLGSDGTNFIRAASINGEVDGTPGTNDMPGRLVFSTTADGASSPTERMRIGASGIVYFGSTTVANPTYYFSPDSGGGTFVKDTDSTNSRTAFIFRISGTQVGSITTSGSATAYNTSSDYRLKENVVPLTGAADRVNQLQVHRFNFIADPDKTVDGFLAHEAQAIVPECVTGTKDEVDDEGNPVYQGIDQSKLVPLLTAALQEALAKIETLEQRLNDAGIA